MGEGSSDDAVFVDDAVMVSGAGAAVEDSGTTGLDVAPRDDIVGVSRGGVGSGEAVDEMLSVEDSRVEEGTDGVKSDTVVEDAISVERIEDTPVEKDEVVTLENEVTRAEEELAAGGNRLMMKDVGGSMGGDAGVSWIICRTC